MADQLFIRQAYGQYVWHVFAPPGRSAQLNLQASF